MVAPETSDRLKDSLYLSDLKLIEANPSTAAMPPNVTGIEPKHGWCYYFEKADLARQQGIGSKWRVWRSKLRRLTWNPNQDQNTWSLLRVSPSSNSGIRQIRFQ